MKTHYLKIRDKFIDNVATGLKRHEYRLATVERRQIQIGDTLILVSNQNRRKFVKVIVKGVSKFASWEQALKDNWEQDFKSIFSSFEEALKECNKFYTRDEIHSYGIIAFDIEPITVDYRKTCILLDTNIIIKRESGNNVSFEVTNLFRWFDKENITKFVHPLTKQELLKHKDEQIRKTMLAKLQAYDELPILQCESDDYFESVISKYPLNDNSKIDNALLKEVYVNNVNILLTDDNLMLLKAEELYIRDKVVTSEELLKIFESYYPHHIEYKMLAVKLKDFAEINLSDNFFDSLREDYEGVKFDNWFKKKALKKEKAYVFENNSGHLEDIIKTTTSEECIKLCQNRSIFNESEIRRIHNRRPIIVKLLDFVSFKKKVTLGALYDNNIVAPDTGPRPFTQITEKQFNIIYKLGMED